jgi:acetyltransferase-like isoleucine patch superfamily enzyme
MSALAQKLYLSLLGDEAMASGRSGEEGQVGFRRLIYYSYSRGFWQLIRGTAHRWRLRSRRGRFFLGRGTRILFPSMLSVGADVAIGDYAYLNCLGDAGVVLGDRVRLREFAWVQVTSHLTRPGVGLRIGANSYIGPHAVIGAGGGVDIGEGVRLGAYVQLLAENHQFEDASQLIATQGVRRNGISIGDDCWIGNGVIVLDGVTVGRGAVVGAGSVVTKSVEPLTVVVGNPARVIGMRGSVAAQ